MPSNLPEALLTDPEYGSWERPREPGTTLENAGGLRPPPRLKGRPALEGRPGSFLKDPGILLKDPGGLGNPGDAVVASIGGRRRITRGGAPYCHSRVRPVSMKRCTA